MSLKIGITQLQLLLNRAMEDYLDE